MQDLSQAFERARRCETCHYAPCVCIPKALKPQFAEPASLREAIEKALCSESPLKALAVEMEVIAFLRRKLQSPTASGEDRVKDMERLEKILGLR
jgi:hypothetical protein